MKMKIKQWGLVLAIGVAAILIALGILYKQGILTTKMFTGSQGDLLKMIGTTTIDPTTQASYQHTSGVLDIQHWVTQNGVPVYFVPVPTLPMVDIEIVFDAGAARNGQKGGVSYLTNILLAEGAAGFTADQVAEHFDNVGAQYHASSQRDMATITLRSLSDPKLFVPALELFATVLSQPSFPEPGFQREKQKVLTLLKKQAQNPGQVASRAFYQALYAGQPYSNWILGDNASVLALRVEDVRAFYKQYYVAKNAVVAIVGNVTAMEASAIAEKLTEKLSMGDKPASFPAVKPLSKPVTERLSFPSSQTHILMGQPLIKQGDPDYYALYVGNHILGGNGSVTRIFNTIRNQHGLAYSAYSYLQPMLVEGPFVLGCQTRNEAADKALDLLRTVLETYVQKGPTEKELEKAKRNILGGYALMFDSNALIIQQIASLGFYRLPLDHFDHFKEEVKKLTTRDIQMAFEKHVSPKNMAVVMVGKSE